VSKAARQEIKKRWGKQSAGVQKKLKKKKKKFQQVGDKSAVESRVTGAKKNGFAKAAKSVGCRGRQEKSGNRKRNTLSGGGGRTGVGVRERLGAVINQCHGDRASQPRWGGSLSEQQQRRRPHKSESPSRVWW